MDGDTREPIRFRSQAEIDKMLERLERNKKSWQASQDELKDRYVEDTERRIAPLKYVTKLSEEAVTELANTVGPGYRESAADWLIFRCDDSRMAGGDPD